VVRRLLIFAATVIVAVVGLPAPSAQAWPQCQFGSECWYDWYSDATNTTLVGSMYVDCLGHQTSEGVRSGTLHFETWHC
jgi:hypothetical protein